MRTNEEMWKILERNLKFLGQFCIIIWRELNILHYQFRLYEFKLIQIALLKDTLLQNSGRCKTDTYDNINSL